MDVVLHCELSLSACVLLQPRMFSLKVAYSFSLILQPTSSAILDHQIGIKNLTISTCTSIRRSLFERVVDTHLSIAARDGLPHRSFRMDTGLDRRCPALRPSMPQTVCLLCWLTRYYPRRCRAGLGGPRGLQGSHTPP